MTARQIFEQPARATIPDPILLKLELHQAISNIVAVHTQAPSSPEVIAKTQALLVYLNRALHAGHRFSTIQPPVAPLGELIVSQPQIATGLDQQVVARLYHTLTQADAGSDGHAIEGIWEYRAGGEARQDVGNGFGELGNFGHGHTGSPMDTTAHDLPH